MNNQIESLLRRLMYTERRLAALEAMERPLITSRVYNDAAITIADITDTNLTFNTERFDYGGLHSTTSNTGRFTIVVPGVYAIGAHVRWSANANGIRQVHIRLNNTTNIATQNAMSNNASLTTAMTVSTIYELAAGDYLQVRVYQSSGGNLNVDAAGNNSPEFWIAKV